MNYRHQFHAGNFADVMKHVLLVQLHRALQKKEKPFLYLDTHAGRGGYDLAAASMGDSLARKPEWPDGIGRIWSAAGAPPAVVEYVEIVRAYDVQAGAGKNESESAVAAPRFYPGSPWIARLLRRPQDRLAFCEKHPEECAALRMEFGRQRGVSIQEMDGFHAIRALLPPPERRALVFLDPPFEAQGEFTRLAASLAEGLQRIPSAVYAVWYPLTQRAGADRFLEAVAQLNPPPALAAELTIAGDESPLKMKGCGLLLINPPWGFASEAAPLLDYLAGALAQAPGGSGRIDWLVPER